jgi:hypothetical protein
VEMKLGFTLDLLLQVTDRMRAADEVWLAVPATRRGRDRDPRVAPTVPAPRLWSHGGQCHTLSGGSAGRAGPLSAKAGSSPPQTVAERTRPPTGRSVSWRRKPTAGDDRIPAASACLRRVAERRARQSPHRGAGCRQAGSSARKKRGVYQLTADGEAALKRWPDASLSSRS